MLAPTRPSGAARMRWMSGLPSRLLTKASMLASGENSGCESEPGWLVKSLWFEPSMSIRYTSAVPVRLLMNAIRVPSGEMAG